MRVAQVGLLNNGRAAAFKRNSEVGACSPCHIASLGFIVAWRSCFWVIVPAARVCRARSGGAVARPCLSCCTFLSTSWRFTAYVVTLH